MKKKDLKIRPILKPDVRIAQTARRAVHYTLCTETDFTIPDASVAEE